MAELVVELPKEPDLSDIASEGGDGDVYNEAFVGELRLPRDEVLRTHGGADLALYEKLRTDDQVKPTLQQRYSSVISRPWVVEPGGTAAIDVKAADDIRAQLSAMAFDRASAKMLTAVMNGYSVGECMFGTDGRSFFLSGIKVRRARRFRFDRQGNLRLLVSTKPEGEVMPPAKFWVFACGADDDDEPYGLGLGHFLYWPVWFKRNAMRFWATHLERFASPTPIAKGPGGVDDKRKRELLDMLLSIRNGGRVYVPHGVDVELLKAIGSSGGDYQLFIELLNLGISKVVLSQTMTTDNGSSRSQSETHERVAGYVTKTDADLKCESFVQGPVAWLTAWNHPGAAVPKVYRDCSDPVDLQARALRDKTIVEMGYQPTQEYIDETYGKGFVPKPNVVAAPIEDGPPNDAPPPAASTAPAARSFAEGAAPAKLRPVSASIDDLLGGDGWEKVIGPEVDALEQFVEGASSLDEVRDRLGELAKGDPKALADALARVMFAARTAGLVGAEVDESDGG